MADTTITVQTFIDNSTARAKDKRKTQWSDAQLLNFFNEGKDYVQAILVNINSSFNIATGTIPLVAGTAAYSLSTYLSDFYKMLPRGVFFLGYKPLIQVSREDSYRSGSDSTGTSGAAPTCFYLGTLEIGFVKTPSTETVAAYPTILCQYYKRQADLALTDNMPWVNIFNSALQNYMTGKAIEKTTDDSSPYINTYNALETAVVQILKDRDRDVL